ncbi:hypothetical protein CLFO_24630 [Clostridium formicaceticum]|uniref:Uncharacterized protein n=1 Tax=Clostridium formicaceticum TaxID=1497 RepID=A0AAC9WGK7_9CLOT|nr:hypothetical protein CLFO_24630 [Clostridium formicaceticum]
MRDCLPDAFYFQARAYCVAAVQKVTLNDKDLKALYIELLGLFIFVAYIPFIAKLLFS